LDRRRRQPFGTDGPTKAMFTGIVEATGEVVSIEAAEEGRRIRGRRTLL